MRTRNQSIIICAALKEEIGLLKVGDTNLNFESSSEFEKSIFRFTVRHIEWLNRGFPMEAALENAICSVCVEDIRGAAREFFAENVAYYMHTYRH